MDSDNSSIETWGYRIPFCICLINRSLVFPQSKANTVFLHAMASIVEVFILIRRLVDNATSEIE